VEAVPTNPFLGVGKNYTNLSKGETEKHFVAITNIEELKKIYHSIDTYRLGDVMVRHALKVQMHTGLRSSEIVETKWSEIDLNKLTWVKPRASMKMKNREYDHQICITPEVAEILKQVKAITDPNNTGYVFHSTKAESGHIHRDSLSKFMRETMNLRGKHVPHGSRSAIKTNAQNAIDEENRMMFDEAGVKAVGDHAVGNKVDKAYLRHSAYQKANQIWIWWSKNLVSEVKQDEN